MSMACLAVLPRSSSGRSRSSRRTATVGVVALSCFEAWSNTVPRWLHRPADSSCCGMLPARREGACWLPRKPSSEAASRKVANTSTNAIPAPSNLLTRGHSTSAVTFGTCSSSGSGRGRGRGGADNAMLLVAGWLWRCISGAAGDSCQAVGRYQCAH